MFSSIETEYITSTGALSNTVRLSDEAVTGMATKTMNTFKPTVNNDFLIRLVVVILNPGRPIR